jgi:hypothetical protein
MLHDRKSGQRRAIVFGLSLGFILLLHSVASGCSFSEEAHEYVMSINRAQMAYFLDNQAFSPTFSALDLGIAAHDESNDRSFKTELAQYRLSPQPHAIRVEAQYHEPIHPCAFYVSQIFAFLPWVNRSPCALGWGCLKRAQPIAGYTGIVYQSGPQSRDLPTLKAAICLHRVTNFAVQINVQTNEVECGVHSEQISPG